MYLKYVLYVCIYTTVKYFNSSMIVLHDHDEVLSAVLELEHTHTHTHTHTRGGGGGGGGGWASGVLVTA